ncbi:MULTISPECIES: 50S ribosomal protein P1 [unclassified Halorubrum]|uniref:50S ribosomal protein P1 n=1 Tax=unclassified Halorubrum TaxID=2642239 RepID=UPI000B9888E0|nr:MULTISPECIES: 50S ribosomal protein P1 [unclassified Halorubrum]OYR39547.1 50S ribosomal protein P1 [Halorubrum sp. Hd13]OYR40976.1 50S ribosomal protein P1 [Halorubrum sp. Eb13]OYR51495.1 50S ribosomal protein P1 [Halorubrum sp. Ea1]OYR51541.1 50S ribosomal protein P1 [Halorubrum sp. Ea8]
MEYVYAALILNETGEEINEENITGVLDAAGVDVEESRVKALVAALEDVDIEDAIETAAAAPAAGAAAGGSADAAEADEADDEADEADEAEEAADEEEEDDDEDGGEGLGELFG